MDTTRKGKLLELKVLTCLFERGYEVAIPFGTQAHWDLLCWREKKWQRIQVKTAKLRGIKKDRVYVDFLRSKDRIENQKNKTWNYKGYSVDEIDWVIAGIARASILWVIPILDVANKRSLTFGLNDYKFNW